MCCLRSVGSFLGVFPSDLLPQQPIARSGTLIVNTDPHTESGSHWLAIHLQSKSHSSFYFDSYGLPPLSHPLNHFYNGTASCRPTTPYSCRDLRVPSVASTAVSSPCTRTGVIHRDSSSAFFLRCRLTGWSQICSPPILDPYAACPVEGSVVVVALRGAYSPHITYLLTRNAYSPCY